MPSQTGDRRFILLLACFLGSGFAALVYETAWTRQFGFVFGTSELAVATVLAAYMAGLALGSTLAARLGPRLRRPVLAYALLELGIGVSALLVPRAIGVARWMYVAAFSGSDLADEGGLLRSLFYLGCSFAILAVPTSMMGATLPLLARFAVRSDAQLGPRVGLLYTVNTLGAVGGTVLTAFLLLPALGLAGTVHAAVAANAAVFLGGLLLARGAAPVEPGKSAAAALPGRGRSGFHFLLGVLPRGQRGPGILPPVSCSASLPRGQRGPGILPGPSLILPVMLLSGAASFMYEVLWTRLLAHLVGGSVYAFATMLAAFLAGIALGAGLASRLATDRAPAAGLFAWAQAGTAAMSIAAFLVLDWMPQLAETIAGAHRNTLLANAAVAALVLLPGTLCIGATFPLAVRILAADGNAATAASARVYAWNTIGAGAGAVAAGFFLLPALGYARTLELAAALNLVLCAAAAVGLVGPRARAAWIAAAGLVFLAFFALPEPWGVLRSSPLQHRPAEGETVYYGVGRSATVLGLERRGAWELRSNGLTEAVIQPRGALETLELVPSWLGALPCLARPEARRMMVVGLGGGVALESVPRSMTRIDVVEIEPEVVAANRAVAARRARDPLADPRVHLVINDARDALTLSRERYDVIVSQPSHPWTAASANLYTREFFDLCAAHLAPEGIIVQWMGLPFLDEGLLRSLLATLHEVFNHVRVYRPYAASVVFLASRTPFDFEINAPRALAEDPQEYARLGLGCPADLEPALLLDEQGVAALAAGASPFTDDRNLLAMRSPALLRGGAGAGEQLLAALDLQDPLRRPGHGSGRDHTVRRLLDFGFTARAATAAQSTVEPAARALGLARVALATGDPSGARELLGQALAADPGLRPVRLLQLELDRRAGTAAQGPAAAGPEALADPDQAVLEGWALQDAADWPSLLALDDRLAGAGPCDPDYEDALRLRIAWRVAGADRATAMKALDLSDMLLVTGRAPADMLMRARAALVAEEWPGLVNTLYALLALLGEPADRGLTRSALEIIEQAAARGAPAPELDALSAAFRGPPR